MLGFCLWKKGGKGGVIGEVFWGEEKGYEGWE